MIAKFGEQSKKDWNVGNTDSVSKSGGQVQPPWEGRFKQSLVGGQRMRM